MTKIGAFFRLTRIEHSLMLVVAVMAAELIAGGLPNHLTLALSLVTPIFISMASFAINDYFDVASDRANGRLDRPIVSGEISRRSAFAISMVCLVIGIGASVFINFYAFMIAWIFGALAMLYSYRLKDTLLLGNAYIALSMGIPFLFGNFVVSATITPGIVAIFFIVFLSGFAREIQGTIRDYSGDHKARKSKNIVYYMKKERAAQIAFILYLEAILISVFVFFFIAPFRFNLLYLVPIVIADGLIAYIAARCLFDGSNHAYKLARNVSLAAMGIALLGYLISAIAVVAI